MISWTGVLASNSHTKIWVAILTFFGSGTKPACGGLTPRQRFPVHLGTTSSFYLTQHKTGQVHTLLII